MRGVNPHKQLGGRLRHIRQLHGIGLRALAAQAGCSPSLLSRIENGHANPSLMTLHKIVAALGANIGELFASAEDDVGLIFRAAQRPVISMQASDDTSLLLERLVPYVQGSLLQANIHIVMPGSGSAGAIRHIGQELGYVLQGRLDLTVDGTTHRLQEGDSFLFDSQLEHSYRNPGSETAKIIWVNTPPTF